MIMLQSSSAFVEYVCPVRSLGTCNMHRNNVSSLYGFGPIGKRAPDINVLLKLVVPSIDLLSNLSAVDKPHCILLASLDVEIVKFLAGMNVVPSVSPCILTAVMFMLLALMLSLPVLFM